jgi:hypothetical protein
MLGRVLPRRVLIPVRGILRQRRISRWQRTRILMLDLIYIGAGLAVLALYGLYAAALRRI